MTVEVQSKSKLYGAGLAVVSAILATVSVAQVRGSFISIGYQDGFSLARQADKIVADIEVNHGPQSREGKWREVRALSKAALQKEPLAASAIRNLALAFDQEGRDQAARDAMFLSLNITRRDLATQFWLIQYFGKKNDLTRVLRHVDQSLRTKEAAWTRLIPALHIAMVNAELVDPMIAMLKTRPPWQQQFWTGIEGHPASLENLADVLIGLRRSDAKIDPFIPQAVINQLGYEGRFAKAQEVYRLVYGRNNFSPKGQYVNNSDFKIDRGRTVFDWATNNSADIEAYIDSTEGALFISANGELEAVAAIQTIRLQAGKYRFSSQLAEESKNSTDVLSVDLVCAEKKYAQTRPVFQAKLTDKMVAGDFTVSQGGCNFFNIRVLVLPSEVRSNRTLAISNISIKSVTSM